MKTHKRWLLFAILLAHSTNTIAAAPLLRPRKYHGPIPKKSFCLRIGFLSGATNEDMYDKLDAMVEERSGQPITSDFGSAVILDGSYTSKLHPRFAIRGNVSLAFLRSKSNGYYVPSIMEDTLNVLLDFQRNFNVELTTIEGAGIFYFADAAVDEFQPYIGGGFSVWIPRAKYKETLINRDTGRLFEEPTERTRWSLEAGIDAILGALYYLNSTLAISMESRYHIAQSHFPLIIPTEDGPKEVSFLVNYTSFVINVGISKSF